MQNVLIISLNANMYKYKFGLTQPKHYCGY